jgi:hypothetical protein
VRTAPPPIPRDPEFDRPSRPDGRKPPLDEVRFYQRLVVNPFLAVLTLFVTLVLISASATTTGAGLSRTTRWAGLSTLAAIVGSVLSMLALQYHCLDCGATGWYHRWRRHACDRVVDRWRTPYSAASHFFPTARTQLVLWTLTIVGGFILWVLTSV